MKRYWMTTQWPIHQGKSLIEDSYECVWVQEHAISVLDRCKEGDIVFIYESLSGPIRSDGDLDVNPEGQMGIVDVVKVSSAVKENPDTNYYEDREPLWWRYYRETETIKHLDTLIPLAEVNKVLGYSQNYNLHGFGEKHSGLKELTVAQAKAFMHLAGLDM